MSMQPMFAIQNSAASSFTSGASIHFFCRPSRVDTSTRKRGIQSGMCDGASFWKNALPNAPSGYRRIVNGRSRRCGTSTGAIAA